MLAAPATYAGRRASGPRPIELNRDSEQILDLLDIAFGPLPSGRGQRLLISPPSTGIGLIFGTRFRDFLGGAVPGFVWEDAGRIVGTMSLLESAVQGRYLVANVAVHPDHRRRGIANNLMRTSMDYIQQKGGHEILLQAERDNEAANRLYLNLDFEVLGDVNQWSSTTLALKYPKSESAGGVSVRPLARGDEREALILDIEAMPNSMRWPNPPIPSKYRQNLWNRINDFFDGKKLIAYVAEIPTGRSTNGSLVGLAYFDSEWGKSHEVGIRAKDDFQGMVERSLLVALIPHIKQARSGKILVNHLAHDDYVNSSLMEANFHVRRELRVMRYRFRTSG